MSSDPAMTCGGRSVATDVVGAHEEDLPSSRWCARTRRDRVARRPGCCPAAVAGLLASWGCPAHAFIDDRRQVGIASAPLAPALTLIRTSLARSSRTESQSSQRSWASSVEHVPSVIESPIAPRSPPGDSREYTSYTLEPEHRGRPFRVSRRCFFGSDATTAVGGKIRKVTTAEPWRLGCTSAPGTSRLTATSCRAKTRSCTGVAGHAAAGRDDGGHGPAEGHGPVLPNRHQGETLVAARHRPCRW